jgi:hypothetical protein
MQRVAPPSTLSSSSSSSAADLLGTIATLVQDTQVDVTRLIYMLYLDVEQQINRADLKSQLTLSTSAVLMAMIVNMGPGLRLHSWAGMHVFEYIVLALYSLFIVSMSFAFGYGIAAAFPRAVKKPRTSIVIPISTSQAKSPKFPGMIMRICSASSRMMGSSALCWGRFIRNASYLRPSCIMCARECPA